ncbi:unnamed protein product [Dracunculus medinensis]|uniref:WD repeat domain-containing protein 83 n=1 Tax=Dracunculus medinensis TaxID=318479 RepID=A0A0N4UDB2_DRAME|nr:unnamed protein product [Dracunculus medinensis]
MGCCLPLSLIGKIDCKQSGVRAVRFNVDGNYCMTCGADKTVKLWNPYKQILLKIYTGTGWEILDAQSSSDNSSILAGGLDKQLTIFDVETGKITRRWRGHSGKVNCVAFNEESNVALSGSQDGIVRCFDVRDKSGPIQVLDEAADAVLSIDVCAHQIASGSADSNVRIYNIREGKMSMDFVGDSATSVTFSGDSQCILVSTKDGFVRLLDNNNGKLLADYTGHMNNEYRIESRILSTEAHVLSGSEDGKVYIWDLIHMSLLHRLVHPDRIIHSVSVHPTKPFFLSASSSTIFFWGISETETVIKANS